MKVVKFGGASVKDADGIKNVGQVLQQTKLNEFVIVVSAMGKTTNALEKVVHNYFNKPEQLTDSIESIKKQHYHALTQLFTCTHRVYEEIDVLFARLLHFIDNNISHNYDFVYDQIVSIGELLSSVILNNYLKDIGFDLEWLDARTIIKTDNQYREANLDWIQTQNLVTERIDKSKNYIIQGFIGCDESNHTTTLGREGSDYSAAVLSYCLDAESLTIWKDVDGVLNADPRYFKDTTLLEQISYREAIELAFYGASVIHPKTLQPLQQKEIPFFVKSFIHPLQSGTTVSKGAAIVPKLPCYIVKHNQHLISIASKDFSFIIEENISYIFSILHKYKVKVHLIQNSAISFSVCIEDKYNNLKPLIHELSQRFQVKYNQNVMLYTIRHFDNQSVELVEKDKNILIKQISRETIQIVTN